MFEQFMGSIKQEAVSSAFRSTTSLESFRSFLSALPRAFVHDQGSALARGREAERAGGTVATGPAAGSVTFGASAPTGLSGGAAEREAPKVGRNDPCPCGSGKKYKKCCGK
jgi:preprotein translocase subunit SecA